MSKQDNLTDFLTDVADAIREKKGTTEKINPQNFSDEIRSLGAERQSVEWNDVNFYDYDGTRLYSYTWDEAMAMTELPPLPTAKGLICQEWNYTLEDIKAQSGRCDIGATYITDDGKTRFYLTIDSERAKDMWLYLTASVSGGIVVDWGDGTVETPTGTTLSLNHKYAELGDYVVAIEVKNGVLEFRGSSTYNVVSEVLAPFFERARAVRKIEIGYGISQINNYSFYMLTSLKYLSIPKEVTVLNGVFCMNCSSLVAFVIPKMVKSLGANAFGYCSSLKVVAIPNDFNELPNYVFTNCFSMRALVLPKKTQVINSSLFNYCISLQTFVSSEGVTKIYSSVFTNCKSTAYFDFSACNTIPTLSNSNSFSGINQSAKIIVPDDLYDEWISATNWSTLASKIVKNSECTRPL